MNRISRRAILVRGLLTVFVVGDLLVLACHFLEHLLRIQSCLSTAKMFQRAI